MSIVTIQEVKGVVRCAENGTAEHFFNVKNATDKMLRVGMHLSTYEPVGDEWLQVEGPAEQFLDLEQMTQVTVKIKVPPDTKPGKYSYRLRIFDPDNPGEIYTDGDPVYFEVPEKKKEVVPEKESQGAFKWWIPAVAGAVIVIGLIAWWMWPSGVTLPNFSEEDWSQAKAVAFLESHGISYKTELQKDSSPGSNREILGQKPDPGTKIKEDQTVTIKVAGVQVPQLEQLSFSAALQRISSQGLSFDADKDLKTRSVRQPEEHEKVLEQVPKKDELVPKKSSVQLTVGRFADTKFEIKDIKIFQQMQGIKISPKFITREVQPRSE